MPFEKNALIPQFKIKTRDGHTVDLWDYRQKSHVAFALKQNGAPAELKQLADDAATRQKTWTWLGVDILIASETTHPLADGLYAIDRYGGFVEFIPLSDQMWEKLEKEYIYYESCNC